MVKASERTGSCGHPLAGEGRYHPIYKGGKEIERLCCECRHPTRACPLALVYPEQELHLEGERGASVKTEGESGQVIRGASPLLETKERRRMAIDEKPKPEVVEPRILVEYGKWGKILHIFYGKDEMFAIPERKAVKFAKRILKIAAEGKKKD